MERLYLIRVDMERFLGPFNLKQLKEAYGRMEFGLQDEVSGSLRQWVTFDDIEGVKRHYPELAQLVQTEMLSGWGLSSHSQSPMVAAKVRVPPTTRRSQFTLYLVLLLAIAFGLGIAFVMLRDGDQPGLLTMLRDRNLYNAQSLYGEQYNPRFEAFMDRNRDAINQSLKKKKSLAQWLPYVRAVAFGRDGRWEGLTAKRLRGKVDEALPQDCSMSNWDQIWTSSRPQWTRFLEGRELPNEEWALLLAFDPLWIRLRSPMNGWLNPGSYHEACLQMGLRALQRQSSSNSPWEAKVFISRLRWQLGVINGQSISEDFEMSGTLWALSCIEDSHDEGELRNCQNVLNARAGWRNQFEIAAAKRRLHLLVGELTTLDETQLNTLQQLLRDFIGKAESASVSYADEIKFYQEIIQQQGNVRQAKSNMQQRLPQLNFER